MDPSKQKVRFNFEAPELRHAGAVGWAVTLPQLPAEGPDATIVVSADLATTGRDVKLDPGQPRASNSTPGPMSSSTRSLGACQARPRQRERQADPASARQARSTVGVSVKLIPPA